MYLKPRDYDILSFIENYGSITANIFSKIHFNKSKFSYIESSRRLHIMHQNKIIKKTRSKATSEFVYYLNKPKTTHDIRILEVYAELIHSSVEILNFELERPF